MSCQTLNFIHTLTLSINIHLEKEEKAKECEKDTN